MPGVRFLVTGRWFLAAAEGCPTLRFSSVICPLTSVFCYLTPELVFHNFSIGCKSQKTPGDSAAGLDQVRNNF